MTRVVAVVLVLAGLALIAAGVWRAWGAGAGLVVAGVETAAVGLLLIDVKPGPRPKE